RGDGAAGGGEEWERGWGDASGGGSGAVVSVYEPAGGCFGDGSDVAAGGGGFVGGGCAGVGGGKRGSGGGEGGGGSGWGGGDVGHGSFGLALTADRADAFQGFHCPNLLVILDEASGVSPVIWEAADGVAVSENNKILAIGNPLSVSGRFYETFRKAGGWRRV